MRRVIWSGPARRDLRSVERWLAENRSPDYELRVLQAIHNRCIFLAKTPKGAPALKDEKRKLIVLGTPYILIYRIVEDGLEILRLFHERQDWHSTL